jgi:hypothetical protein
MLLLGVHWNWKSISRSIFSCIGFWASFSPLVTLPHVKLTSGAKMIPIDLGWMSKVKHTWRWIIKMVSGLLSSLVSARLFLDSNKTAKCRGNEISSFVIWGLFSRSERSWLFACSRFLTMANTAIQKQAHANNRECLLCWTGLWSHLITHMNYPLHEDDPYRFWDQ